MSKRIERLEDLTPDQHNANKGTKRGRDLLEKSLRKYGAGRSILVDKHGNVIAGNKTLEQAAEMGLEIEVVKTDGRKLVVVQREDVDIDSKAGRELAVADNRVAQVDLDWDADVLVEMRDAGVEVGEFFFEDELTKLVQLGGFDVTDPDAVTASHSKAGLKKKDDGESMTFTASLPIAAYKDVLLAAVAKVRQEGMSVGDSLLEVCRLYLKSLEG